MINAIHLHPNAIALWVENSAYVKEWLNYVPYTEKKTVAADLKKIYSGTTIAAAEQALDDFELTWVDRYSAIFNF